MNAKTTNNLKPGPFEIKPGADKLAAHIVSNGSRPNLLGYSLHDDLAKHYAPSDVELLALTGKLPDRAQSEAYRVARIFLMAPHPGSAENQAASLTHMLNVDERATVMVANQLCATEASAWAIKQKTMLDWIACDCTEPGPSEIKTQDELTDNRVAELINLLGETAASVPGLDKTLTIDSAITCVLCYCGLATVPGLQAVRCMARLPAVIAQGMCWSGSQLLDYPTRLPDYEYQSSPPLKEPANGAET